MAEASQRVDLKAMAVPKMLPDIIGEEGPNTSHLNPTNYFKEVQSTSENLREN